MDINAKIKWAPGMPLTANALNFFDDAFDRRKEAFARALLGPRIGILPGSSFSCDAMFVGNSVEINVGECRAWLSSGRLLDISGEKVAVPVPSLTDGKYYLCASFGEGLIEFESKELPLVRPSYEYSIQTKQAVIGNGGYFPLLRLVVADGSISLDRDYIVPCMQLEGDGRFLALAEELDSKLTAIVSHPNARPENGKLWLLYFSRASRRFDRTSDTSDYLHFTEELAQTLSQLYFGEDGREKLSAVEPGVYDMQEWFGWLLSFMDESLAYLDQLVIEDNHIDYDELKKQITDEVYERVRAEMDDRMTEVKKSVEDEISERLETSLRNFIEGEFRNTLHDTLQTDISGELSGSLYKSLYDALYEALFVPEKEEEVYTPTI